MASSDPELNKILEPALKELEIVKAKCLERLNIERMDNHPKLTDPSSPYHNNPLQLAMATFAFYNCFKCKQVYFGGKRDCEQNNNDGAERKADEFVCMGCSDIRQATCTNAAHRDYLTWKCRFCCKLAVWFCWGTTHFCEYVYILLLPRSLESDRCNV